MSSNITVQGDTTIVALEGEIDLETSPQARSALLSAVKAGGPMVVDLSAVPYMDSSGIASLIEAYQEARKGGGSLVLAAVSPTTLRALKLARLDQIFTIYDTVADAVDGT